MQTNGSRSRESKGQSRALDVQIKKAIFDENSLALSSVFALSSYVQLHRPFDQTRIRKTLACRKSSATKRRRALLFGKRSLLKQKDSADFDDKSFDDINNNKWHFHDFQFWFSLFRSYFAQAFVVKKEVVPTFLMISSQNRRCSASNFAGHSKALQAP